MQFLFASMNYFLTDVDYLHDSLGKSFVVAFAATHVCGAVFGCVDELLLDR